MENGAQLFLNAKNMLLSDSRLIEEFLSLGADLTEELKRANPHIYHTYLYSISLIFLISHLRMNYQHSSG